MSAIYRDEKDIPSIELIPENFKTILRTTTGYMADGTAGAR